MSIPALIAWYRNTQWIASRTALLPRNENDTLETPPDRCECGKRFFSSFAASMKFTALSACSSMPVAIGKMLESKMMSSGGKPTFSVSSL